VFLASTGVAPVCIFPLGTVLPAQHVLEAGLQGSKGFFQLTTSKQEEATASAPSKSLVSFFSSAIKSAVSTTTTPSEGVLGEVVFTLPPAASETPEAVPTVTLTFDISLESGLAVTVTLTSDKSVLATLAIPSA
jgi:hypothetical protein